MGVIYVRPNLINGKKYVGQATDLKVRQNRWNNLNQPYAGPAINAARAKYGIDNFGFEILKECKDDELDYWEKYYVKELNTKAPYGYNLTDGGGGMSGYTLSEETKKKMSECHKGKHRSEETKRKLSEAHRCKKLSEETRKKLSEAHKGKTTWNKGKHCSEETRKKLSEAHRGKTTWLKGKKHTEEHKKKLSEAHRGKKLSEETKKKMSEAHKGKTTWNKGKHHSEETRKKISEKHINGKKSKLVLQIDQLTDTIIAEFPSIMEVERQFGINHSNISQCCKGKYKTCGGFKWQYK